MFLKTSNNKDAKYKRAFFSLRPVTAGYTLGEKEIGSNFLLTMPQREYHLLKDLTTTIKGIDQKVSQVKGSLEGQKSMAEHTDQGLGWRPMFVCMGMTCSKNCAVTSVVHLQREVKRLHNKVRAAKIRIREAKPLESCGRGGPSYPVGLRKLCC